MCNFKLKSPWGQYKIRKEDNYTISNDNLTDEKALEFLAVKPKRIELFEEYPENWEEQVKDFELPKTEETEEEKANRLAAEAEAAALENARSEAKEKVSKGEKVTKEDLQIFKLKELKELFPKIKSSNKTQKFIENILKGELK